MTGDRARLINFVEKFIGTVRFGNDEYAAIVGYGDYKLGDTIISRVYYVEGLKHNLFSVGQFCDGGLEVAFRQHSCHIRNYDMVDLLKGSRTTNLYSISLNDMMSASPVCLLTKASSTKSWLWHRRLNHLNFGTLNELARKNLVRGLPMLKYDKDHLCPSCQLGKSKKATHPLKTENTYEVLPYIHMGPCGPLRTEVSSDMKYALVKVDVYTRFWMVRFFELRTKLLMRLRKFIVKDSRALNATRTSVSKQNGVVERRNDLLGSVVLAHLCKSFHRSRVEAVSHACYDTSIDSLVHSLHGNTIMNLLKGRNLIYVLPEYMVPCAIPTNATMSLIRITALQSGRSRSALVKDPVQPSVPPTRNMNAYGSPSTTSYLPKGAHAVTEKPLTASNDMEKSLKNKARSDRLFIAHAASQKHGHLPEDRENRLLNGELNEVVYVRSPEGFVIQRHPCMIYKGRVDQLCSTRKAGKHILLDADSVRMSGHTEKLNLLLQLYFLGIDLLAWFIQKSRKVPPYPLQKLNNRPIRISVTQILWMRSQLRDYGFAFNKNSECIYDNQVLLLYARFATLLPLLGVKQISPETLKELQDESVSKSKGRTVADSIAETLTRPTAYKVKTDCSIIPVWVFQRSCFNYSLDFCAISPHTLRGRLIHFKSILEHKPTNKHPLVAIKPTHPLWVVVMMMTVVVSVGEWWWWRNASGGAWVGGSGRSEHGEDF
ncbi:retrovirus-related pol polyprotein from transposon TNT 1-94 [Tanacetum coccineum]